jgi:uncharacterized protein (TIGR00106 family)
MENTGTTNNLKRRPSGRLCCLQLGKIEFSGGTRLLENPKTAYKKGDTTMKVLVDLCIVPIGVGVSLSPYIAACEKVLTGAGLKTSLHSYGTNIEGEWDAVFAAVKRCHEVVHGMGAPRITTTIKLGTRTDRSQTMEDKVRSVQEKL